MTQSPIDFDCINSELEQEIVEAFAKAITYWPRGSANRKVPRQLTLSPIPLPAIVERIIEPAVWEFRRELIENVSGFPLLHYYLNCNNEWRLIAVHGRL